MALSEEQKRIIEESVKHLLDFPTDLTAFSQAEKNLSDAFTQPVDKTNDFFWLRECLENPTTHFQSIASSGAKVTIGEVQEHLIRFITQRLQQAPHDKHHLQYWDADKVLDPLRLLPEWNTDFAKDKSPVEDDNEHPYAIANLEGKTYRAMVGLEVLVDEDSEVGETFLQPFVHVSVQCSPDDTFEKKILFRQPVSRFDFSSDEQEEAFILSLKTEAGQIAELFAAKCGVHYLKLASTSTTSSVYSSDNERESGTDEENEDQQENQDDLLSRLIDELNGQLDEQEQHGDISDTIHKKSFPYSNAVKILVTDEFFLEQLQLGKVPLTKLDVLLDEFVMLLVHPEIIRLLKSRFCNLELSDYLEFSLHALENFATPSVTDLIANNICSVAAAKTLLNYERTLVTHHVYHAMLISKKLSFNEVTETDEAHSRLLVLPPVANLIQREKLSFAVAKSLPLGFREVFVSNLYVTHFSNQTIPWTELCSFTSDQCKFLLNKSIARLVANGIVKIQDIGKLSIVEMKLLEKFPKLLQWMELKLIDFDKFLNADGKTIYNLYCRAYVKRLFAVATQIPVKINGSLDDVEKILAELPGAAADCCVDEATFKGSLAFRLVKVIEFDIKVLIRLQPSLETLCGKFLAIIKETESSVDRNWMLALHACIEHAGQIQTSLSNLIFTDKTYAHQDNVTLFASTSQQTASNRNFPTIELHTLCKGLASIMPICSVNVTDTHKLTVSK